LPRRQHRAGLLTQFQKGDNLRDVLGEDKVVTARQNRNRTGAEALQLGPTGGISEDIDRFELDPTDREKLFESQAAGSARLPERLKRRRDLGHRPLLSPMSFIPYAFGSVAVNHRRFAR
jgi:hypothetical protein